VPAKSVTASRRWNERRKFYVLTRNGPSVADIWLESSVPGPNLNINCAIRPGLGPCRPVPLELNSRLSIPEPPPLSSPPSSRPFHCRNSVYFTWYYDNVKSRQVNTFRCIMPDKSLCARSRCTEWRYYNWRARGADRLSPYQRHNGAGHFKRLYKYIWRDRCRWNAETDIDRYCVLASYTEWCISVLTLDVS
jgi:hypothetical protein